jgi:hypothetical protein
MVNTQEGKCLLQHIKNRNSRMVSSLGNVWEGHGNTRPLEHRELRRMESEMTSAPGHTSR